MTNNLQLFLLSFTLLLFLTICYLIYKKYLSVKLSFIWLLPVVLMIISLLIPNFIDYIAHTLGFAVMSNMIFFGGFVFLFFICLSLTIIVSKQAKKITLLIQEISLLKQKGEK